MLELEPRDLAVIMCVADPTAVDAIGDVANATACRVAPDEVMLVGEPADATEIARETAARATAADPDAIVLDAGDGWAAWTLRGDDLDDAFGRLSAVVLAPGFSQGDVAHVPVKILRSDGSLDLLVPAMWGNYLRERIVARCPGVVQRSDT